MLYFLKYIVSLWQLHLIAQVRVCTLSHKLLLKRSFKCNMKVHSISCSTTQKFKTISLVLNGDEIHFYDSKGHTLPGRKEWSFYFGEMAGTLWEVYLG